MFVTIFALFVLACVAYAMCRMAIALMRANREVADKRARYERARVERIHREALQAQAFELSQASYNAYRAGDLEGIKAANAALDAFNARNA